MTYVRNADLTIGHIKHLAHQCNYDLIDPTPDRGLVCAVKTPSGEIVEFKSLPDARRFLKADLREIEAERKKACKDLGIQIATKTLPYYYEHQLDVINDGSAVNAANIYFGADLIQEYVILGHHVEVIEGRSVLVIWTPTELSSRQQQDLLRDWRPVCWSVYNLKHNQSLAAFQAWYDAQDKQTQLDYWMVKRADLAVMQEQDEITNDLPAAFRHVASAHREFANIVKDHPFHNTIWLDAFICSFKQILALKQAQPRDAATLGKTFCQVICGLIDQVIEEPENHQTDAILHPVWKELQEAIRFFDAVLDEEF